MKKLTKLYDKFWCLLWSVFTQPEKIYILDFLLDNLNMKFGWDKLQK